MAFLDTSNPSIRALAFNEILDPPVCVVVGEFGTTLVSTGREYDDGYQVYTWEQIEPIIYSNLFDVAFGHTNVGTSTPDLFMAASAAGLVLVAPGDALAWEIRDTGIDENLYGIAYIEEKIWIAVGAAPDGGSPKIMKTTDAGTTWTEKSNPSTKDLYAIAVNDGTIVVVGADGEVMTSTDNGDTWTQRTSGVTDDLYDLVYGPDAWFIVGDGSTILKTTNFAHPFDVKTSPVVGANRSIAYSGDGGLMVIVGEDALTITSLIGDVWAEQDPGLGLYDLHHIRYGDNRFVAVGDRNQVAYSSTGAGRPAFDLFEPISDKYRAQCFCQSGAYVVYGGLMIFEEDADGNEKWNYYPNRIQNAAPGTVDDFTSVGWWFADLPTSGAILDMVDIEGGIVIAETNQLSLLTDAGSLTAPWMYHDNYGDGIKPISNLTSFNGMAFVVADDGLIYTAGTTGVARLPGFFDLTRFEDWEPGSESAWIKFDPVYQTLFVFRQKSPWTVFLVNDESGGVSELDIPTISISGVTYEPRSAFIIDGLRGGIHISYTAVNSGVDEIVTARLDLDGAITGIDEPTSGETSRHKGDFQTGSFRITSLGGRGEINEVLIRTWADPDSTERPDIAILVKEESEDSWQTNDMPAGTITVHTSSCSGADTAWSRYIAEG